MDGLQDAHAQVAAWFDAYARPLHRYLARRNAGPDTEDLVAEVFAIAWRRRTEVPPGAELPWLYRTAWHVLANHRRRPAPVLLPDAPQDDTVPDVADRVVDDQVLATAWSRLSTRDREILRLAAWEGLDGRQLAQALGVSPGGAAAALWRARRRLAEEWDRADRAESA